MNRPAPTLLFLAFLAFFMGLGRMAIADADEAFYARAAWEMVERGDWLTPYFNDEPRWQKPVLYYWLTAGVYLLTGPTEWAARVWSALAGLGLVFLTWSIATHLTRRADVAFLAGSIVATCFGCFAIGRMALPDLPLAFSITLTIWAALRAADTVAADAAAAPTRPRSRTVAPPLAGVRTLGTAVATSVMIERAPASQARRWWAVAGTAAGVGFLMKGPVALALPALVLLPIWWRERRALVVDRRGMVLAGLLALAIGVPWYAAMWTVHGAEYLHSFFVGDNLERFATDRFNEPRSIFYYVPVLIGGLLPWSIFLLVLPWRSLAARVRGGWPWRITTTEWRLLAWALIPLLFYSVSFGKQPRYILPVLAPVAILLACVLTARLRESAGGGQPLALRGATWGTAALFAVFAVVLARTHPLLVDAYPWASWMGVGALLVLATALGRIAARGDWIRLPGTLTFSAALLLVVIQFGALAGIRPAPVEQLAAAVRAAHTGVEPIATYRVFVRNLIFYTGIPQAEITDDIGAVTFLRSPERVLLVVPEADLPRVQDAAGQPLRTLGSVRAVDTASFRLGTLLRPDPARYVQHVVLVTNR